MGLKCRISHSNGEIQVIDNNGNESQLYNRLLEYTGNQEKALDYWVIANDSEFLNTGESTSINEIESFLDSSTASKQSLSPSESFEVSDFMRRVGEQSLDELYSKLAKIFKPNGVFEVDTNQAISSGIFTQQELQELDLNQMQDILLKIEGQLAISDVVVEPGAQEYDYINSDRKTILGTFQKVSQAEFDNDIINAVDSFTDQEAFLKGIKTLPYSEFIQKFEQDPKYAASIMDRFKGVTKIPTLSVIGKSLSDSNNEVYTTVKNTVLVSKDDTSVEVEIDYLNGISEEIWSENGEDIKTVLKEVEQSLADVNLDVVGIAEKFSDRASVMRMLYTADALVKQASEENLQAFATVHKEVIGETNTIITRKLEEKYTGLNVIRFNTNKSADFVFNNYGLIEIGENLYHKVDQTTSIDVMRDFIYDQFLEGKVDIPSKFIKVSDVKNGLNKPTVLEGISSFLMSREGLAGISNKELYSAYQVAFDHSKVDSKEDSVKGLSNIKTDEKYLKRGFISDFYNYILNEKVKNSETYKSILSKFQINDRGISITERISSIDSLEFKQELEDYIRLHRDSNMKYLLETKSTELSEDLLYLNFPEKVSEFEGKVVIDGDLVITNSTSDNYIKVGGELYRKEIVRDGANLFVRITSTRDNVYLTNGVNFDFDRKAANKVFDEYALLNPSTVSYQSFQTVVAKSRINDNMSLEFKELSTLKDKSYVFLSSEGGILVHKDGKEVGNLSYEKDGNSYTNPRVSVAEMHRSKGVGTELYLQLFDKAKKEGKVVNKPTEETPQSKSIFARVGNIINKPTQQTSEVQFQKGVTTEVQTPKEVVDAVLDKLKETGLANEVYSMTSEEIKAKLNSLGVDVITVNQIVAYHGTLNPNKDILKITDKNADRYGELLSGTYFGGKDMAVWFSGKVPGLSRVFEVGIEEKDFATVDMKEKTPVGTEELLSDGVLTQEEYDDLLSRKKSGEIKGIILENVVEKGFSNDVHTQYLVFDEGVIEKLKTTEYDDIAPNAKPVTKLFLKLQKEGINITHNGFVHDGNVYLNTDNPNILNTQIHEFGHLFNSWAKKNRRDIYDKGIELIQSEAGAPYIDFVKQNQPNLKGEALYEEALTQAIGDQGQRIVEENAKESFGEWMMSLWGAIKDALGLSNMTSEQISNLTLKEFARAASTDLLEGNPNTFQDSLEKVIKDSGISVKDAISMNNGNPMEMTPNGEESLLYNNILSLPGIDGNTTKAAEYKAMVYSENFKSWFGDWQSDSSNKSTVVDKNGEPLLVYHGGPEAIRVFDESRAGETTANNDHGAFYFSNEYDVAEDYGEQSIVRRFEGQSKEDLIEYYDLTEEQADEVIDDIYDYANRVSVVHPVFLNMRKPMVVKYEGANINLEKAQREIGFVKNQEDPEYEFTDEYIEFDESQLEDYESEIQDKMEDGYSRDEAEEEIRNEYGLYGELVELDGLIMRDVVDNIGDKSGIIQDEYVAITPSQIKSVFNEGTFSEYRDEIVYQVNNITSKTLTSDTTILKESIENTASIFDSQLELLDLYSSKEEAQIKKDTDCG